MDWGCGVLRAAGVDGKSVGSQLVWIGQTVIKGWQAMGKRLLRAVANVAARNYPHQL